MITALNVFLPLALYAGFMLGLAKSLPAFWFGLAGAVFAFYAGLSAWKKQKPFVLVALFTAGLLMAGYIEYSGIRWLHTVYLPFIVFVSALFPLDVLLLATVSVPLLEIRHLVTGGMLYEELSLIGFVIATGAMSYLASNRLKKERKRLSSSLESLKDIAIESLTEENIVARKMAIGMEFDAELKDILNTARHTTGLDAVHLFALKGGGLALRCSTTEEELRVIENGLTGLSLMKRKNIVVGDAAQKQYNLGYVRKRPVSSAVLVPVADGRFAFGVLAGDSEKTNSADDKTATTLRMFAGHLARTLEKERIYAEMERSHFGLRILHEESARLLTSLKLSTAIDIITEGMKRIAPLSMAFFIRTSGDYALVRLSGIPEPAQKTFKIENTLIERAVAENQHIYVADLRNYNIPVVPFNAGKPASAFILPLSYEKDNIGVVVMMSEEKDALNAYQMELIEVLGNQASISLKNAMLHAHIERLATTDSLTGLYNHRHFQERLSAEFKRMERTGQDVSFLLVDIDFFKKVNDTYGHPAGDAVLRAVSQILKNTVREVDIPARYGGEEFAAVLVGTDKKGAVILAERLRSTIESTVYEADGKKLRVTASIGIASAPVDADKKEELIEKADKALYHAKRNGRNRAVEWSASMPAE